MLSLVRWSAKSRVLPGAEVDEDFRMNPDLLQLFVFTTDSMAVGTHRGLLSVKLVTHGAERYRIGRRDVELRPGRVLVVNAGQEYASSIEEPGTRAISFFVPDPIARQAFAASAAPGTENVRLPEFFQTPFRTAPKLAESLAHLSRSVDRPGRPDLQEVEERLIAATVGALASAAGIAPFDSLSDRVRRSTREDLIGRILRVRELIHDTRGRVSLDVMARTSGLSRYHFLRVFTDIVGCTPARYAKGVRLEWGRTRLAAGDPPAVAARAAGYRSSSTFLRALRTHRSH